MKHLPVNLQKLVKRSSSCNQGGSSFTDTKVYKDTILTFTNRKKFQYTFERPPFVSVLKMLSRMFDHF